MLNCGCIQVADENAIDNFLYDKTSEITITLCSRVIDNFQRFVKTIF
jgi:hypothetical protein